METTCSSFTINRWQSSTQRTTRFSARSSIFRGIMMQSKYSKTPRTTLRSTSKETKETTGLLSGSSDFLTTTSQLRSLLIFSFTLNPAPSTRSIRTLQAPSMLTTSTKSPRRVSTKFCSARSLSRSVSQTSLKKTRLTSGLVNFQQFKPAT